MRGQALRYLGWQILDRTGPRLLGSWLIAAIICVPLHFAVQDNPPPAAQLSQIVRTMHLQFAALAVTLLFHGIVAEDRTRGYYRFYLAKPVSPVWFYGQSIALALIAMILFTVGFIALFVWSIGAGWEWRLLTSSVALGLLLGGLVFAFSTVTQRDWIGMVLTVFLATILRGKFPRERSDLGRVLDAILPPNQLVDETVLTAGQWLWVALWGVGLFALGLWILRTRPLGED